MKRIVLAVLFTLFISGHAYAAATCTAGGRTEFGAGMYEILLTCTAHTDGTVGVTLSSSAMDNVDGKWLYHITTKPGSPAMTDGSELEIRDSIGREVISSADNGNDFIDSVSTLVEFPSGPDTNGGPFPCNDDYPWTVYVENNAVSGGVVYIYLTLVDNI